MLDPAVRSDRPLSDLLRDAASHGIRLFQYRDKAATMNEAYLRARALRQAASEVGALLIVNDRCDLALAVEADGVHLGQEDLPITYARRLLGPDKIIGLSTHNPAQVRQALAGQPDYVAFGPVFRTLSKVDHEPVVGLEGLREVRTLTALPMFAIGGITADSTGEVVAAGADGVAVISAILTASDMGSAIRNFQRSFAEPDRRDP
ncbi:MAG: thiamine phosphate synthase [Nitrospira sp.]|nr:thiamine phosphate synthase [Nitrospira sp.]